MGGLRGSCRRCSDYGWLGYGGPAHELCSKCAPPAATPNTPEPPSVPNASTPIAELVLADIRERDAMGAKKYGTRLQAFSGRKPLVDAYQETLDLAMYLRQKIEEENARAIPADQEQLFIRALMRYKAVVDREDRELAERGIYRHGGLHTGARDLAEYSRWLEGHRSDEAQEVFGTCPACAVSFEAPHPPAVVKVTLDSGELAEAVLRSKEPAS